jgi:hypothetical protein
MEMVLRDNPYSDDTVNIRNTVWREEVSNTGTPNLNTQKR